MGLSHISWPVEHSSYVLPPESLYKADQLISALSSTLWKFCWLLLYKDDLLPSSCTSKIHLWQNQYQVHESGQGVTTVTRCSQKPGWNIPGMTALALSPQLCFQPATNNQRVTAHMSGICSLCFQKSRGKLHYLYLIRNDKMTFIFLLPCLKKCRLSVAPK